MITHSKRIARDKRRRESVRWAARFHDKLVKCGSKLGVARAFMAGAEAKLVIYQLDETSRIIRYQDSKLISLADLSEATIARLKGDHFPPDNLPPLQPLPPVLEKKKQFWDKMLQLSSDWRTNDKSRLTG